MKVHHNVHQLTAKTTMTNTSKNMSNVRDWYTTDIPLFQLTSFSYSLQMAIGHSYATNALIRTCTTLNQDKH